MPTTLDCTLSGDFYANDRMREIFDSRRKLQAWLDVEAALAEAQAEVGVIPADAAEKIREVADADLYDLEELRREIDAGRRHQIYPMIRALSARAGEYAGGYVHWGATTQDILDTGLVLQLREALDVIEEDLDGVAAALAQLASSTSDTVTAGRTHWQHSLPMTLGLKFAILLDEIERHRKTLARLRGEVLVAQLGGGGGTLASLGEHAIAVRDELCRRLDLAVPDAPWFASRDRPVSLISFFGLLAATLEKTVLFVGRSTSTEIGEMAEPVVSGQVGSSTMPQKRNPVQCERAAALAKLVRGLVPVAQECMVTEHDRDMSTAMAEWFVVQQGTIMTGALLEKNRHILEGLEIFEDRVAENLDLTGGAIVTEAVMMGLAEHVGRVEAHALAMEVARSAADTGRPMVEVLAEHPTVASLLDHAGLAELVEPRNYVGVSVETVDAVLRNRTGPEPSP